MTGRICSGWAIISNRSVWSTGSGRLIWSLTGQPWPGLLSGIVGGWESVTRIIATCWTCREACSAIKILTTRRKGMKGTRCRGECCTVLIQRRRTWFMSGFLLGLECRERQKRTRWLIRPGLLRIWFPRSFWRQRWPRQLMNGNSGPRWWWCLTGGISRVNTWWLTWIVKRRLRIITVTVGTRKWGMPYWMAVMVIIKRVVWPRLRGRRAWKFCVAIISPTWTIRMPELWEENRMISRLGVSIISTSMWQRKWVIAWCAWINMHR